MMLVDIYKVPIGVSLAVIGGVLLLSVIASWLFQSRKAGEPHLRNTACRPMQSRMRAVANPAVIGWIAALLIAVVLILVKWDAITRGPTSEEAITVIAVVERDLAGAKGLHARTHSAVLNEAHENLDQAWDSLTNKRYQQAIEKAYAAGKLLEDLPERN